MRSHDIAENLAKAEKLPLGHYGRKEAEDLVAEEYRLCRAFEGKFSWKSRYIKVCDIGRIIGKICFALGINPPKRVILESDEVHSHAGAHYSSWSKEIHFPSKWVGTTTLLHELSHHVKYVGKFYGRGDHGPEFVEAEELVFQVAKDIGL